MSRYNYNLRAGIPGYDAWKTQEPEDREPEVRPTLDIEVLFDPTADPKWGDLPFQVVFIWTERSYSAFDQDERHTEYVDVETLPSDHETFLADVEDLLYEVCGMSYSDFDKVEWSGSLA